MEKEVGKPIFTFSYNDLQHAQIDEDKLAKLQEYEKKQYICPLAVEPQQL